MQSRGDDGNLLLNQMEQQYIFFSFFFFYHFHLVTARNLQTPLAKWLRNTYFSLVIGAQSVDMDDLGFKNRFYNDYRQPPATACS